MSFSDFVEGFADGFIPTFTARMDRQDQEDAELAKIKLKQKGKLYESRAEQERAARALRQQAENLYSMTGRGDVGAFYQLLETGMKPTDIIDRLDKNPNLFQQMGGNTSPTRAPANVQTPFEQGTDILEQFGGPTVEAGAALDARRAAAPAVDLAPRDVDLLARTIIGEAASEPTEGKIAVANVVMNRIQSGRFGGSSMQDVLFARNQFEPWTNPATRNRLMNISTDSPEYQEAFRIAQAVTGGTVPDVTNGATHFANPDIVRRYHQEGKATSSTLAWVQNIEQNGTRIGRHVFGNADAGANSRQTTMSTGGSINPTDQQMAGAFSEPTVVPETRMPEPQTQPANQQQIPDNAFSTLLGVNQAQRDRDIGSRVDRLSEAAGFTDMPSGFASPPQSNFRLNLGGNADMSKFPSIASADSLVKIDGAIAEAEAKGLLNQAGADQWLSAVEARKDALVGRQASSYLSGVNNQETAVNARNRALADIENGVIPPEAADSVLSAIDRTVDDILRLNWKEPATYDEAKTRVRVATETQDTKELELLGPYLQALAPANATVTNVIVRPTDGSLGRVTAARQMFDADTANYQYATLDGQPLETEGAMVIPINEDIRKAATAVQSDTQLSVMYRDATTSVADLSRYVVPMYELTQLMDESPEVATYTAGLALGIDRFFREADSMLGLLTEVSRERNLTPEDAEAALRQNGLLRDGESLESVAAEFEKNARSGVVANLADARRAYEAYILLGTFRTGGIEGQEGRAVSNKLFEELQGFMRNARNSDQLRDRVRIQIDGMAREINQTQQAIINHPQVRGFIQEYGYNPLAFGTMDEVLQSDPRLAEATNFFLNAPVRGSSAAPTQEQQPQQSTGRSFTVTDEMAARNSRLAPLVGRTVVAVPAANGQFTIEIVE